MSKWYHEAMQTPYAKRITLAAGISLLAHVALLVALAFVPESTPAEASVATPVRVRLEPPPALPETDAPRRLVEVTAEDLPPEQPTDLIAEVDARARDMSEDVGDDATPQVDELAEFERIAALPAPVSVPPPLDAIEPIVPEPREPAPEPEAAEPAAESTPPPAVPEPEAPRPAPQPAQAERERIEVAQARPEPAEQRPRQENPALREPVPPSSPRDTPSPSAARMQGAVVSTGFLGFEAMRDDIAPYLRHVQDKVERQWRLVMELEYRGAARARAVIDCAIKPSGELAFVRIHDDGGNLGYAAYCANAIRRAAPFDAFPFEAPALYRDEEIVIRWTFQFM